MSFSVKAFYEKRKELREAKRVYDLKLKEINTLEDSVKNDPRVGNWEVKKFGPFTLVQVSLEGFTSWGISKKCETDIENVELATKIALGRAKKQLLEKIKDDGKVTREPYAG